MKSPIAFLLILLQEMGEWCHTSTSRDAKTISARYEHEGLSFLTITLPAFGKDLQKALDQGYVDRSLFQGFSWTAGLPRFLGGFLDLVFDRCNGLLLDDPSIDAIRSLHQLTQVFGKIKLPCSDARERAAFEKYIECEQDVRRFDLELTKELESDFVRLGRILWADVFTAVDARVYNGEIVPKHGSGSTADGIRGNAKYRQFEWTSRLEEFFPSGEFLYPSWSYYHELQDLTILEPGAERPVKVITVPKTLKTPRLIAMEPTCMQYAQQAILEGLVEAIEANDTARSLISWSSQLPNQQLARQGSRDGSLATLDMSEASDRVSNRHVRLLLARHPHLMGAVDACRSRKADVRGYGVIPLAKFASMGSALCFPFEAIVFTTVIFIGIERALSRHLSSSDVKSLLGKVRVYGDDIIVPVEFVNSVVETLTAFGLKVNSGKSFWTGKFRESCGGDYYDGHDISVVRVRSEFPSRLTDAHEIQATVALRNHLWKAGFSKAVSWLDDGLSTVLKYYPFVGPESPALGRHSYDNLTVDRHCASLQRPLVKAHVVKSILPLNEVDGYPALMKWFLKRSDLPFATRDHLLRSGRPVSVDIKTRYVSSV